jgi:hypothetical protein
MKPYTEAEVHNAIVAVRDGMPIQTAAKAWHIPQTTLWDRLKGTQSHQVAADPQRPLSEVQEDQLAMFLINQSNLGHALTRWETRALAAWLYLWLALWASFLRTPFGGSLGESWALYGLF